MLKNNDSVLFVCTGNTCRSPMAKYLAMEIAKEKKLALKIESRGLQVRPADYFQIGATKAACRAVREMCPQSPIYKHKPQMVSVDDLESFPLILTMGEGHRDWILGEAAEFIPGLEERVFAIREYVGQAGEYPLDITDPMGAKGQTSRVYAACRNSIGICINQLIANPNIPHSKIFADRDERYRIYEEKMIKQEIAYYSTLLDTVKSSHDGANIKVNSAVVLDVIDGKKSLRDREHLIGLVDDIRRFADKKGLEFFVPKEKRDEGED